MGRTGEAEKRNLKKYCTTAGKEGEKIQPRPAEWQHAFDPPSARRVAIDRSTRHPLLQPQYMFSTHVESEWVFTVLLSLSCCLVLSGLPPLLHRALFFLSLFLLTVRTPLPVISHCTYPSPCALYLFPTRFAPSSRLPAVTVPRRSSRCTGEHRTVLLLWTSGLAWSALYSSRSALPTCREPSGKLRNRICLIMPPQSSCLVSEQAFFSRCGLLAFCDLQ